MHARVNSLLRFLEAYPDDVWICFVGNYRWPEELAALETCRANYAALGLGGAEDGYCVVATRPVPGGGRWARSGVAAFALRRLHAKEPLPSAEYFKLSEDWAAALSSFA
jgi:hypothetical protein